MKKQRTESKQPAGENAEVLDLLRSIKKAGEAVEGRCNTRDVMLEFADKLLARLSGEKVDGTKANDLFWLSLAALQISDECECFDVQKSVKDLVERSGGLPEYAGHRLKEWAGAKAKEK